VIADCVEEHGFVTLPGVIRRDPETAKQLMPTPWLRPSRFRRNDAALAAR
jgi:hypothetical protein